MDSDFRASLHSDPAQARKITKQGNFELVTRPSANVYGRYGQAAIPKWSYCNRFFVVLLLGAGSSGCATYQTKPLMLRARLAQNVAALNHIMPNGRRVPLTAPLSVASVAALAVLNDPDLIAARAQHKVKQAELLNAGMLPDPTISGGFAAPVSGPADIATISGGLMQDISAFVTYSVSLRAAKMGVAQVDATILWQEWQVASQAEQLCITINGDEQTLASLQADRATLVAVNRSTHNALASGNVTIVASSSSQAALASTDTALDTAIQSLSRDRGLLDALLGLEQRGVIAVAKANVPPINQAVTRAAIATLAIRRPDLIALRYGYQKADAKLRAAIISQFFPISVGATGNRDASKAVSIGPQVSLILPLFNRNQGRIAIASATRDQLAAQFQASLADAEGGASALRAQISILQTQSVAAMRRAVQAEAIAARARAASANGTLNALAAVNLLIASGERRREAIRLRVQLLTARLSLATLLGIGLPPMVSAGSEPVR